MVFVKRGIAVPAGSRCCRIHLYNNQLSYEALQQITHTNIDSFSFDAEAVVALINDCWTTIQKMKNFDFDDPASVNDEAYRNITGLQKGRVFQDVTSFTRVGKK